MKPILLKIAGIELFSYPLFIGLAWGASYHIARYFLTGSGTTPENNSGNIQGRVFNRIFFLVFLFAWLGAKIFFLIFSVPNEMEIYSNSSSFWLGGGFVFYGGLVGGSLYLLVETMILKSMPFKKLGLLIPALTISHGIGRIGCFLTGCCYGTHCDLPWAIKMHGHFRHPVQLYESLGLFTIAAIAIAMIKRGLGLAYLIYLYIFGYGALRFLLEFFRGDKVRGIHYAGLSTSQYVSLALVMIGISLFLGHRFCNRRFSN